MARAGVGALPVDDGVAQPAAIVISASNNRLNVLGICHPERQRGTCCPILVDGYEVRNSTSLAQSTLSEAEGLGMTGGPTRAAPAQDPFAPPAGPAPRMRRPR